MVQRDPPRRPHMIKYGVLMALTILPGLLLSIGLPNIPGMYIARVQVDPRAGKQLAHGIDELRVRKNTFAIRLFTYAGSLRAVWSLVRLARLDVRSVF